MSDLVAYWRNEARYIDVAVADGDDLTAEYAAKAIETADTIEQLQADKRELMEALGVADAAIKEWFRYLHGGEMRGSYDGKPEREQLRKAGYATTATLTKITAQHAK